jgi:hypothetical protein
VRASNVESKSDQRFKRHGVQSERDMTDNTSRHYSAIFW